jgi:hypothetical protein
MGTSFLDLFFFLLSNEAEEVLIDEGHWVIT